MSNNKFTSTNSSSEKAEKNLAQDRTCHEHPQDNAQDNDVQVVKRKHGRPRKKKVVDTNNANEKKKARINPYFVAKTNADAASLFAVVKAAEEIADSDVSQRALQKPNTDLSCPHCAVTMTASSVVVTATIPAQRRYDCPSCGARIWRIEQKIKNESSQK